MNGNGSHSRSHHGFTLLELIVVIGIIIILISILIPALSNSRMQAQIADTKSQLSNLASACEQYNQIFQAYPGPVAETDLDNKTGYSGNQNLLIGLSRKWSTTATDITTTGPVTLTDAQVNKGGTMTSITVDNVGTLSPTDWSRNGTSGVPYTATVIKANELHPTYTIGGFPVLVDHFKEAMPILYYRKIPGRTNMTTGAASTYAYMQNANSPIFGTGTPTVTSSIGSKYTQVAITSNYGTTTTPIFRQMLGNYIGTTWSPKGGYVLISAGPDHLYGTADDIIVSGGY